MQFCTTVLYTSTVEGPAVYALVTKRHILLRAQEIREGAYCTSWNIKLVAGTGEQSQRR
jgi:hypothetical protein